jgi:hypothetical protein
MRHSFGVALSVPILLVCSAARLVSVTRSFQGVAPLLTLTFAIFGLSPCASWSRQVAIDTKPYVGRSWAENCLIHRPCEVLVSPLPPCPREMKPLTLPIPTTLQQTTMPLSIAGRVRFGRGIRHLMGCPFSEDQSCCNRDWIKAILVGEDGSGVELPNIGCFGDESRLCCNVDAKGQMVVATGVMRTTGQSWFFRDEVTLCAL